MIGDYSIGSTPIFNYRSRLQKLVKKRRKNGTRAKIMLEQILTKVNNGVLKGKFQREWVFGGKWFIDFFFHENRLGIETDGSYPQTPSQRIENIKKEKACDDSGITLVRLTNESGHKK